MKKALVRPHVLRTTARVAGVFYLVTFVTGGAALILRGRAGAIAGLIAGASYVGVTVLLYRFFKPVSPRVSLVAAAISLAGIAAGPLQITVVNPLVFFGGYCLLLAYLISRSNVFPRALAPLMVFAAIGWLTFASSALTRTLFPYSVAPGLIGEGVLTGCLLACRFDEARSAHETRVTEASA